VVDAPTLESRLPDWAYDELVLAVELYLRRGVPGKTDPEIAELSVLLRRLPIHVPRPSNPKFRDPAGVYRKLNDIRTSEPDYPGVQTRGNKLDNVVLEHFLAEPDRYAAIAAAIRARASVFPLDPADEETEVDFPEGRLLFRLHRARERDPRAVAKKKAQAAASTNGLACEVCGFDFGHRYGELGEGFIECHHLRPLADTGPTRTRAEDLALLCSNCHRMAHRRRPWPTLYDLRAVMVQTGVTA
jgi:5-methylcytosine-specific restriction protein A